MSKALGSLQDNVNQATRTTSVPGETAIAVVGPDGTSPLTANIIFERASSATDISVSVLNSAFTVIAANSARKGTWYRVPV